jgi:hypothetical protein
MVYRYKVILEELNVDVYETKIRVLVKIGRKRN